MSEELHNNERHLKEIADKHTPIPPPLVWDEIEQVLDNDKRKRRLYPILWIFVVLVTGATVFISLKVTKDKESLAIEREAIISDDQRQSDSNPQDISSVNSEATSEWKKEKRSLMVEREIIISDDQKQSGPNFLDIRSVDSEAINEVKKGQNANFSETTLSVSDNQERKKGGSEKLKSFATHQHQLSSFNTSRLGSSLNENVTAVLPEEDIFTPGISTQSTFEKRNIIRITPLQRPKRIRRLIVSRIPIPDSSKNLTDFFAAGAKGNALLASPWFVELRGGVGKNLSNPVLLDNIQGGYRLNTESRWYSWSASMQLGYQFDDHWYTTVGFDLNQTKHRFDFWRRNVSGLIVSENQNFQITNSDFFTIGDISYTFADIGLSLGRRININKWHFSLEGGAIFNFLFTANGKVQVGGLEFSRLEDQEAYFNPQIGMGARLSAMLDHPISDQLWISVGPSYYQYFNTVSSGENPLRERNSILQVMAKVRYHF